MSFEKFLMKMAKGESVKKEDIPTDVLKVVLSGEKRGKFEYNEEDESYKASESFMQKFGAMYSSLGRSRLGES